MRPPIWSSRLFEDVASEPLDVGVSELHRPAVETVGVEQPALTPVFWTSWTVQDPPVMSWPIMVILRRPVWLIHLPGSGHVVIVLSSLAWWGRLHEVLCVRRV